MKTSNKLIILFVALLYVVPLSAMLIDLRNYEDGEGAGYEVTSKSFEDELQNFESYKVQNSFTALEILGAKKDAVSIKYVESEIPGIKFNSNVKDYVKISEKGDGKVNMVFEHSEKHRYFTTIFVYGKNVSKVEVKDMASMSMSGTFQALILNLDHVKNITLSEGLIASNLSVNSLGANNLELSAHTDSTSIRFTGGHVIWKNPYSKSARIQVENTDLNISNSSDNIKRFDQFQLTTLGNSQVKFENVRFKSISGSISDSTTINLPAGDLKKLLN